MSPAIPTIFNWTEKKLDKVAPSRASCTCTKIAFTCTFVANTGRVEFPMLDQAADPEE